MTARVTRFAMALLIAPLFALPPGGGAPRASAQDAGVEATGERAAEDDDESEDAAAEAAPASDADSEGGGAEARKRGV